MKAIDSKTRYAYKTKKHFPMKPKQDFLAAAVRKFYTDFLKRPALEKTLEFGKIFHDNSFTK